MLRSRVNKLLISDSVWITISLIIIAILLAPLFYSKFYIPIFDNLDSNVVWYKILSSSGKIFADNSSNIPNIMSSLPRATYPKEVDTILWLYYFFEPIIAYKINEIIIHIVAFISMYLFLDKYIVSSKGYYKNIPAYIGAIYFTLLPFWSGAGLSIAILPLVTYSLLNIKNGSYSKWDWILLALLPIYSFFVFLYIFYISITIIYFIIYSIQIRRINRAFLLAIILMGVMFLFSEYRLVLSMFFDNHYLSSREEYDVYFKSNLLDSYRAFHLFILNGHTSHASALQDKYLLPLIIISILLSFTKRVYNWWESIIIWILIIFSFMAGLWKIALSNIYTMPLLILLSLLSLSYRYKNKNYRKLVLLFLLIFLLSAIGIADMYSGFHGLIEIFPILSKLNILRIAFLEPFIWGVILTISIIIFIKKLRFSYIFIIIFLILQFSYSLERSFYQTSPKNKYASFEDYYNQNLFKRVKNKIPQPIKDIIVVSYGLEPAVLQFNGFNTVGGYMPNYPLDYKKKFRKIIHKFLDSNTIVSNAAKRLFDNWGGKLYLMETTVTLEYYKKSDVIDKIYFDSNALCDLNVSYMISSKRFGETAKKYLNLISYFPGKKNSWDIYLYKLKCK